MWVPGPIRLRLSKARLQNERLQMMTRLMSLVFLAVLASTQAFAQVDVEFHEDRRHHLSVVFGGTYIDAADETLLTLGVDYEYRVSELFGVGAVVEQTFGEIDATTLLAVTDVHLWRGLALQIGPGVEFVDNNAFAIGRLGALYEIELGHGYTIAPQVHYDLSSGEDAVVFGFALGRAF